MRPWPEDFMHRFAYDPIWEEIRADHDRKSNAWFRSLTQGAVVHYHHGFDCWVRCEVVDHPLRPPGCKPPVRGLPPVEYDATRPSLVPVMLVGPAWAEHHECTRVYWREKVQMGRALQPSATNVYESPYYRNASAKLDPTKLEAWFPTA